MGASKNKYVVYSQVNRMPLFALEQIVLLSFAERATDARLHMYARAKDRNVCDITKTEGTTRRARRSRPSRSLCSCFFRSVLLLCPRDARSLQLYVDSNTNNRCWRVQHVKTRRTADAVIAILVPIAGLRQATRNLHYDDSLVKK